MLKSVEQELAEVQEHYPTVSITRNPDGSVYLELREVLLPDGWNKTSATVLMLLPVGYPTVRPNGFDTDAELRLKNGAMPGGGSQSAHFGRPWLHLCWQPGQAWADYSKDPLWKHFSFARQRFELPQ